MELPDSQNSTGFEPYFPSWTRSIGRISKEVIRDTALILLGLNVAWFSVAGLRSKNYRDYHTYISELRKAAECYPTESKKFNNLLVDLGTPGIRLAYYGKR